MIKDRQRSRAYPSVSLGDSVSNLKTIYNALGFGGHDRPSLAKAMGAERENGATNRKIATLVLFGLVEKSASGYAISQLGKSILRPLPGEDEMLLRKAFLKVPLYHDIWDRYQTDRLPEALGRILERGFEIVPPNGDRVARVLIESARFANLLTASNDFVSVDPEADETQALEQQTDLPSTPPRVSPLPNNPATERLGRQPGTGAVDTWPPGTAITQPDETSISLGNPSVKVIMASRLTVKQKKRVEDWIEQVLKPWIKFNVETDEDDASSEGDM